MPENVNSWTVQSSNPLDHSEAFPTHPGQVIHADQLPDPDVQEAAGIDPEQWRRNAGHLYVDSNASLLSEDRKTPVVAAPRAKAHKAK